MDTPEPAPHEGSRVQEPRHWLAIAGTSLVLGTLIYAGLLFPFAGTDGLLGLNCHGWVKGPRGAASLLFILGWGCAVAVMAGRVYGRTETLGELLQIKERILGRNGSKADKLEAGDDDPRPGASEPEHEDEDSNAP